MKAKSHMEFVRYWAGPRDGWQGWVRDPTRLETWNAAPEGYYVLDAGTMVYSWVQNSIPWPAPRASATDG